MSVLGELTHPSLPLSASGASFRTRNFHVEYQPAVLVVSILLAMAAATVALTLFFRFKAHWDDGWWKRALCAFALAVAVSSMHYTGMAGTKCVRAMLRRRRGPHSPHAAPTPAAGTAFALIWSTRSQPSDTATSRKSS